MVSMEKEKTTPLGKSEGAEPERFIGWDGYVPT